MTPREEGRLRKWRRLLQVGIFVAALAVPGVADAAQKFAVVSSSGTLVRGVGATGATHVAVGTYEVQFSSNQTECAYVATPGDTGAGAVTEPAVATVASRFGNTKALFIQTLDQSSGSLKDEPFHVQTFCGTSYYAVIGADGSTARGPHVTSSARMGTGTYEVIFDKNVSKCAFTAAIGATGTGQVTNPGVLTVSGRSGNVNGVFVKVLSRAGAALDSPFHLAVSCGGSKLIGVINADGSRARGVNVVSSAHLVTGQYEVIFDTDVSACAYTATVGATATGGPTTITTATRSGNPNGVLLSVRNTDGTPADQRFHLFVSCPPVAFSAPQPSEGGPQG